MFTSIDFKLIKLILILQVASIELYNCCSCYILSQ